MVVKKLKFRVNFNCSMFNFGFTLEQLLISLLINSIVFLSLASLCIVIKEHCNLIEQKINVLYNQTIIDFFVRNKIRKSGYKGVVSTLPVAQYSSIYNLDNSTNLTIIPQAPIAICKAISGSCNNFVSLNIIKKIKSGNIKPNSNILIAYDIPEKITYLVEDMTSLSSPLKIAISAELKEDFFHIGDNIIIADLEIVNRFVLSNEMQGMLFHEMPFNNTNNLIKKFLKGASVFRFNHIAFYLAKNYNHPQSYSLFMEELTTNYPAEAIVDNVDNFLAEVVGTNDNNSNIYDKSKIGWIHDKYIVIKVFFKNKFINQFFKTNIEINNN